MTTSILCQLNGGCMGCCGHDFRSKESISSAIHKNTIEFKNQNPQTEKEFLTFRDRRPAMDLRNGVCRNLIEEAGCFFCPLHQARHNGKDLRENHCDTDYLCKTATEFARWNDEKKKAFVSFIKQKKLDNITYSIKMDKGELLKEFQKNKIISSV